MRVLEIGSGCGYSAAVTSALISPGGEVFSLEIVPELHNLAATNLKNEIAAGSILNFFHGDGSEGLQENAPYDRIYLTAGVGRYFYEDPFVEQLSDGGILLYPEAYGSMFLIKKNGDSITRREYHGVGFVFLRGSNSGFAFNT
jgi:protein-L-isoaspartate(D-aspartate) O-methyltransferase